MKKFNQFVKLRENEDFDDDKIQTLYKIIKVAWHKHKPLLKELLDKLANNDPDIEREVAKLNMNNLRVDPLRTFKEPEKDEIKPPEADSSPGLNNDGN